MVLVVVPSPRRAKGLFPLSSMRGKMSSNIDLMPDMSCVAPLSAIVGDCDRVVAGTIVDFL